MIFVTVMVLLLADIPNPGSETIDPLIRVETVIIGVLLSFLTLFVFWIIPKIEANQASRKVG